MGEGRGEGGQQRAPGVPTGRRGRRRRGASGGERLRGGRGGCSSCRCRRHSDRAAAAAAAAAAAPDVDDVEPVERGERVGAVRGAAFLCFFFLYREDFFSANDHREKNTSLSLFSSSSLFFSYPQEPVFHECPGDERRVRGPVFDAQRDAALPGEAGRRRRRSRRMMMNHFVLFFCLGLDFPARSLFP